MRPQTFASRLAWLEQSPYKIVSLQQAIKHSHRDNCIALTMDDGWAGTYELVGATLEKHNFPLMLYVTTYYAEKQIEVINVALSYMLWKTNCEKLNVDIADFSCKKSFCLLNEDHPSIVSELCGEIDKLTDTAKRSSILKELSLQLKVGLTVDGFPLFRLLNEKELQKLERFNVDHQLHTHRHCSPQEELLFKREITENITSLKSMLGDRTLDQFCYPSGEYYEHQLPWLRELGVETATTIYSGMLTEHTDLLQTPRFLDGEDVHQIEFEAEICGFMTIFRRLLNSVKAK